MANFALPTQSWQLFPYIVNGYKESGDFPGGPVVKTLPSRAEGAGSIPGRGAKIPDAPWPKNQNIKQKQYCSKFNKDLKNGLYQKKKNSLKIVAKNLGEIQGK